MNGDTPIDCFHLRFSQKEATQLSGVEMTTINNWLWRGEYILAGTQGKRPKGGRAFSIADVAALHAMHHCIAGFEMRPSAASLVGQIVYSSFEDGPVTGDQAEDETKYDSWHLLHRTLSSGAWSVQRIWHDRKSGVFYHSDPAAHPAGEHLNLFPHLPHVPCFSFPTSAFARRVLVSCCEHLKIGSAGSSPK